MSRIIEALEKAKKDGHTGNSSVPLDERQTLARVTAESGSRGQETGEQGHNGTRLPKSTAIDSELLKTIDPHVMVLHKPMSVVAEQYRSLRNRIERTNFNGGRRTLAVTSAVKGEGKSVTAVNLALTMAQEASRRVLLVDADLRRPKLHKLLGLASSPGLADHLQGNASATEIIREFPCFDLRLVTAGSSAGHPGEMLASREFQNLVEGWGRQFDYVIFDTPPLHPISDVSFLTESVEGILLVVQANKTAKGMLKQALDSVPPDKVIGTVLNRAESFRPMLGYRYGYGYGYGGYGY